jgi:hypothetical protein
MPTDKALSRLPLLLALLALATAISTSVALWVWLPNTTAAESTVPTTPPSAPESPAPSDPHTDSRANDVDPGNRFASDAEALSTASAALTDYLEVSDTITADGGAGAERLTEFVTADYLPLALDEMTMYSGLGIRSSGPTLFDSLVLEDVTQYSDGSTLLSVSFCVDRSKQKTISGSLEISGGIGPFRDHFVFDFVVPANPDQRPLVDYTMFASDSPLCPSVFITAN